MNHLRIGIDLGGTKTELVVMDEHQRERFRSRAATPSSSYDAILESIANMVEDAENEVGEHCTIGIGIPGAISERTRLVKNANTTCLIGHNLEQDLTSKLSRPVRIENDANCFTLSESVDGSASHGDLVFGVIIGTGVGGGLVHNKRLLRGRNRIAGEWGHNPIPSAVEVRRDCYCGRHNCVETYLSGPALSRDHIEHGGAQLTAAEVASRATAGNPQARATLARYVTRLAGALATVINVVDPDVIVLGGGLSQLPALLDGIRGQLPEHVFSDFVDTELVLAHHGPASGVRGAACLWTADEAVAAAH